MMSADLRCFDLAQELSHQPALARVEVRLPGGETRPIEGVVFAVKPIAAGAVPRRYVQIVVGPASAPAKQSLGTRLLAHVRKAVRHGA